MAGSRNRIPNIGARTLAKRQYSIEIYTEPIIPLLGRIAKQVKVRVYDQEARHFVHDFAVPPNDNEKEARDEAERHGKQWVGDNGGEVVGPTRYR